MATKGPSAVYDIGNGNNGTGGVLNISGTAAVFLRNKQCIPPTTTTHVYKDITGVTGASVYGVPCSWTGDFGAYLRLYTLSYDANGGSGTVPGSVTQHIGTTCPVSNGSGLSRTGYLLAGWTKAANGSGTAYAAGDTFTFSANATLYAQWLGKPVISSAASAG